MARNNVVFDNLTDANKERMLAYSKEQDIEGIADSILRGADDKAYKINITRFDNEGWAKLYLVAYFRENYRHIEAVTDMEMTYASTKLHKLMKDARQRIHVYDQEDNLIMDLPSVIPTFKPNVAGESGVLMSSAGSEAFLRDRVIPGSGINILTSEIAHSTIYQAEVSEHDLTQIGKLLTACGVAVNEVSEVGSSTEVADYDITTTEEDDF